MKCERKKREKEGRHVRVENDAMESMRRQCIPGTEREVPGYPQPYPLERP